MKSKFVLPLLAVAFFSCNGNKQAEETKAADAEAQEIQALSVEGKWRLMDYAGETEMGVVDSLENYYLVLAPEDHSFSMLTDCNSIGGSYVINGDSLQFDNITSTLMTCPDEKIENAMKSILPRIDTYAISPDSVLRLRSDMRTMAQFKYVEE